MREKTYETKIKKFLEEEGAWFLKTWSNGVQRQGVPDILACVNGYFVGIEVKAEHGRPSALQLHHVEKINEAGGFAMILYPSAFERFKAFIESLANETFNREEFANPIWK